MKTVPWRCQEPRGFEVRCVIFEKSPGAILNGNPDTWWGPAPAGALGQGVASPAGQGPRHSLACPAFMAPRQGREFVMGQGLPLGRCRGGNQDVGSGKLESLLVAAPLWASVFLSVRSKPFGAICKCRMKTIAEGAAKRVCPEREQTYVPVGTQGGCPEWCSVQIQRTE